MRRTWTEIYEAGRDVLRITFVEPVRDGRPRPDQWPLGLRSTALISAVLSGLLIFTVAISGWLRATDSLAQNALQSDVVIPSTALPLLVVSAVVSFALVMTAALHVTWWLRILLLILGGSTIFLVDAPALVGPTGIGLVAGCYLALLVFTLARARRKHAWWELPVVLILVTAAILVPLNFLPTTSAGTDWRAFIAATVADNMQLLILPMIAVAGFAPAQIVITGADAIANRPVSRGVFWTAFSLSVIVLGWSGYQTLADSAAPLTPLGALATASIAIACVAAASIVLTRSRGRMPAPATLPGAWSNWVYPLAVAMAAILIVSWVASASAILLNVAGHKDLANAFLTSLRDVWGSNMGTIWRGALGAATLIAAWRLAARRRTAEALVMAVFGARVVLGLVALAPGLEALSLAQPMLIGYVAAGLALTFALVQVVRRQFDRNRATGVLTVLLVAALFPYRNALSDPISAVLAVAPTAMLVVGLAWRLATEASVTYNSSRAFPQPTRVLLFLASGLLAFVDLAILTLTRSLGTSFDTSAWGEMGDVFLGEPLYLAGLIAALWLMLRPHDQGEAVEQLTDEAYDPAEAAADDAATAWTPPPPPPGPSATPEPTAGWAPPPPPPPSPPPPPAPLPPGN